MREKVLMKGNEAFGAAAILAGCDLYFGYPITPQNELPEYMSRELGKAGGTFTQAESELAAINAAYGGALCGKRVFITSSSPGIALMQEGLSFACAAHVPFVIMNVSRGGPGIGGIQPGQADYRQVTKGGGNGDYHLIVYAPASIQESVDLIGKAFEISIEYQNPVMIFADGMIGQMMEPVLLPEKRLVETEEDIARRKPWALTGHKNQRERNYICSLYLQPDELEANCEAMAEKYARAERELPEYQTQGLEGAEVVFIAFGTVSRVTLEAIDLLEKEGIRAGLIRPVTLWPFPAKAFDEIDPKTTKMVICAELSMGQMIEDVDRVLKGKYPLKLIQRSGGMILTPTEIVEKTKKLLSEAK